MKIQTSIVHHNIDTIRVLLFQEIAELLNALRLTHVESMVADRRISAILFQHFGLLELRILLQGLYRLSSALR